MKTATHKCDRKMALEHATLALNFKFLTCIVCSPQLAPLSCPEHKLKIGCTGNSDGKRLHIDKTSSAPILYVDVKLDRPVRPTITLKIVERMYLGGMHFMMLMPDHVGVFQLGAECAAIVGHSYSLANFPHSVVMAERTLSHHYHPFHLNCPPLSPMRQLPVVFLRDPGVSITYFHLPPSEQHRDLHSFDQVLHL